MIYKTIDKCRSCLSEDIELILNLGKQPLANSLLKNPSESENFYPLSISFCNKCKLVQLNETISPEVLFSKYVWVTGTSRTARNYAERFYDNLIEKAVNKDKQGYVLEIASNDGTFLKPFYENGHNVMGVDPAKNISEIANNNGINTINAFFNDQIVQAFQRENHHFNIIFARNVVPHVANLHEVVKGIGDLSSTDTLIAIEIHYAKIILEELHYDSIYHEHLCYFTLESVKHLFEHFGLYLFDIEKSPISGGSLVLYISKEKKEISDKLKNYLKVEKDNKTNLLASWQDFAEKVKDHKQQLLRLIGNKSTAIAGYGASARSSTLLNYCNIDSSIISAIADQNKLKQGLYTAGTHIPIFDPESIMQNNPEKILLLGWNFRDEIINILREKFHYKGDLIIPLPNNPAIQKYEGINAN